jgi:hypothetical protein
VDTLFEGNQKYIRASFLFINDAAKGKAKGYENATFKKSVIELE